MASPSIAKPDRVQPRAIFRLAMMGLALVVCGPMQMLGKSIGAKAIWAKLFLKFSGWIVGADVRIIGTPLSRDVLFIANHISWLDILVLGGRTGSAFVAKADMAPWPVLGWMARLNNSVYVARDDRFDVEAQANAMKLALETHQPLALFPEGTTGDGISLLPFRSSLLAAVAPPPAGIAIQPVAIDYGCNSAEIAWTDDESVGANAMRVMGRRERLPVTLHFMEPLDISLFTDRKAITAHSRDAISGCLGTVVPAK